jgi:hypothetical protein
MVFAVACSGNGAPSTGGSGSQTTPTGPGGGGSAPPPVTGVTKCDEVRGRVEQLYRGEAQAKEPKRVEDAVADNTAMVLRDCATDPARFVPCIAAAKSVAELEKQCVVPLDDEGTEGEGR